jgi:hypothetical protein
MKNGYMNKSLLFSILIFAFGQTLIWFQSNGQFMWTWFKNNPLLVSLLGVPISYLFIYATKLSYEHFGALWPGRMIGFTTGVLVFSILAQTLMSEGITLKTGICLVLSFAIICIQVFMK